MKKTPETLFVWKMDGIDAYASPSLDNKPVDMLFYGDDLDVLEILDDKTENVTLQYAYSRPADGEAFTHTAKWVKVSYLEDVFYVLDTYLVAYEPPIEDRASAFVFEYYMEDLSPVTASHEQGKTADFCERRAFHYENGMHYTMTDFGPCEQCGHSRAELYFPHLDTRESLVMAMLFVDVITRYENERPTITHKREGDPHIEVHTEHGMAIDIQIKPQAEGILIKVDMYM